MATSLFDLQGKRILVTGSNGGIGFHLARGLAEHGATTILNGRNPEKLRTAADALRREGWHTEEAAFDVTIPDEVGAAIDRLTTAGPVDVLVNNAGVQRRGRLEEISLGTWNEVLSTNLTSAFLVAQRVVPSMIARGGGKIVNVCSLMSDAARTTTGPYTAAKGGLKMLTKAMCADWAAQNIQVNAIGPGYILTEMTQVLADDAPFDAWVRARTPARRWGRPEELVGAAVFLSSAASDFINGQLIYVDGGMLSVL